MEIEIMLVGNEGKRYQGGGKIMVSLPTLLKNRAHAERLYKWAIISNICSHNQPVGWVEARNPGFVGFHFVLPNLQMGYNFKCLLP